MNGTLKKLIAFMAAMMLGVSVLCACSGSEGNGGSEESVVSEESMESTADAPAEGEAGVRGVVITVPEGWTLSEGRDNSYLSFTGGDKGFTLRLAATDSADLEERKTYDDEVTTTDINEYYAKYNEELGEDVSAGRVEKSDVKVCGADGHCYKRKAGDGYVDMNASWILDDNIYYLSLFSWDNFDPAKGGEIKDDPQLLSDEDIAMFEDIMSGARAGDGDALLRYVLTADSIGKYAFDIPEGYRVSFLGENHLSLKKDGSDAEITLSITTDDDLKIIEDGNGDHPESLEEEWNRRKEQQMDSDKTEIAGCEGVIYEYPDADGKMYTVNAEFMGDGGIYNIVMSSDVRDKDGKISADAKELTSDEIALFEKFVGSFRKK